MNKRYYLPVILWLPFIAVSGTTSFTQDTTAKPTVMDEVVFTQASGRHSVPYRFILKK